MKKFNLGIVVNAGKPIGHRSLFKIICNPILRLFGWQIGSVIDLNKEIIEIEELKLTRCPKVWTGFHIFFELKEGEHLIKERMII